MKKGNVANFLLLAFLGVMLLAPDVFASAQNLPWEGPLDKVKESVTGPVAFVISLLGVVGAGAMLIFGGEIGTFLKVLIFIVLVISLIIMANNFLAMYSTSGAVISVVSAFR